MGGDPKKLLHTLSWGGRAGQRFRRRPVAPLRSLFFLHRFAIGTAFTLAFAIVLCLGGPAATFALAGVLTLTSVLLNLGLRCLLAGSRSIIVNGMPYRSHCGSSYKPRQRCSYQDSSSCFGHIWNLLFNVEFARLTKD